MGNVRVQRSARSLVGQIGGELRVDGGTTNEGPAAAFAKKRRQARA